MSNGNEEAPNKTRHWDPNTFYFELADDPAEIGDNKNVIKIGDSRLQTNDQLTLRFPAGADVTPIVNAYNEVRDKLRRERSDIDQVHP